MYRSQNRLGGKAPTIGLLVDWVNSTYQTEIIATLRDAAASASVNLLCFVGGPLRNDGASPSARHRLYQLCGSHNVDGVLLLSSTLTHEVGQSGLIEHCQRYHPLPLCSIGIELPSGTSVLVDNEAGMREVITHLIRDHGARRLAFVRGPLANSEAESRFSAYTAVLAQSGITLDPRWVFTGDFMLSSGRDAVQEFARVYGSRLEGIDAIAASNDAMAAGVLAALEERSIRVPEQIAVTGFDDCEDARLMRPPLTTLKQPLDKQARQGLRTLLDSIQFGSKTGNARLPTELVIRRSCGCQGAPVDSTRSRPPEQRLGYEATLMMRRQRIIDSLTRAARGCFGAAGKDWQGKLFNALLSDLRGAEKPAFAGVLQEIADKVSSRGVDLELCDDLISVLRDKVGPSLGADINARERMEDSFHHARLMVSRTAQRDLMREHLLLARRGRALNAACGMLAASFDLRELAENIQRELPRLDIECCVVALYQKEPTPRNAHLLAAFDRRSGRRWDEATAFEPRLLLPPELLHADDGGRSFLVFPLYWKHEWLGHILFDFNIDSVFAGGAVAEAISVAVWGARLTANAK